MTDQVPLSGTPLARYREYLLLLARLQIGPRMRSKVDPSDIVQEALLKAHKAFEEFRGETEQQLAAWLRTILANTLANALRSVGRRGGGECSLDATLEESSVRLEKFLAGSQLTPEQIASQNEQLLRLATALTLLPEDQRTAIEMKHLRGWPVARICEEMSRTKPAVVGLLVRGLRKLRQLLDDPTTGPRK
jgi:RNA polymerase sigma-70 factor (ECF subfamily)